MHGTDMDHFLWNCWSWSHNPQNQGEMVAMLRLLATHINKILPTFLPSLRGASNPAKHPRADSKGKKFTVPKRVVVNWPGNATLWAKPQRNILI